MKIKKRLFACIIILLCSIQANAQIGVGDFFEIVWDGLSDHPFKLGTKNRTDTSKWVIENKSKNGIWGNATYVSVATTFSKSKEYEVSIGRTKCVVTKYGRGMGYANTASWGITLFSKNKIDKDNLGGKLFIEYNHRSAWLLGSFVLRADYSNNFTDKHQFITPSAGITIIFVDFLYSYAVPVNYKTENNYYKSGFTIRVKYLLGRNKCEINRPKKCGC
jgi:hypothetical protein